ncbi:hypothetical protein RRG08_025251 [Elysia crispata]|uniref:Uncharacterized protein n=1 Tax=Elysia crispata TaxID=231223 RepID=A0AAE1AA03_9GAST|nr:hypothetical protein RRG08_025251 [Elysia crispata]
MDRARESKSKSTKRSTTESDGDVLQPSGLSSSQHGPELIPPSQISQEYGRTLTSPTSTSCDANCHSITYQANGALMLNSNQSSCEQLNQLRQPEQSSPNFSRDITCPILLCRPTCEETHNCNTCQIRLSNEHYSYLRRPLHADIHSNDASGSPTLLLCPPGEVTPNSANYQSRRCAVRNSNSSYQTQFENGNTNPHFHRVPQLQFTLYRSIDEIAVGANNHLASLIPNSHLFERPQNQYSNEWVQSPRFTLGSTRESISNTHHWSREGLSPNTFTSDQSYKHRNHLRRPSNSDTCITRTPKAGEVVHNSADDATREGLMPTSPGMSQSQYEHDNRVMQRLHSMHEPSGAMATPISRPECEVISCSTNCRTGERLEPSQPLSDRSKSEQNHRPYQASHAEQDSTRRLTSSRYSTCNSINCQYGQRLMSESVYPLQTRNLQNAIDHSSSPKESRSKRDNLFDRENTRGYNSRSPSEERPPKRHRASGKPKRRDLSPKDVHNNTHCSHGKVFQPKNNNTKQNSTRCGRSCGSNEFSEEASSRDLKSQQNTAKTQSTRYTEFASADDTPDCDQQSTCNRNDENGENITSPRSSTHTISNTVQTDSILSRPLELMPDVENQQLFHIGETSQLPSDSISQREGNHSHIYGHRLWQTIDNNVDEQSSTQNEMIRESDNRPENTVGSQLLYQAFILNNIFNNCNRRPAHPIELLDVRHELLLRNLTPPVIQPLDYLVRRCGFLDLQWQSPASTTDLIKRFHALLDETFLPDPLNLEPSLRLCSRFFDCLYRPYYGYLGRTYSKISKAMNIFFKRVPGRSTDESCEEHTVDDGISFNPCSPSYSPVDVEAFMEGRFEQLFSYYNTAEAPRFNRELQERSEALFREFRRLNSIGIHNRTSYKPSSPSYQPREVRISMEDHSEQPTEQDYTRGQIYSNPHTVEEARFHRVFQESEAMFREFPHQNSASSDLRRNYSDIHYYTEFEPPRDMPQIETPRKQNRPSVVSMSNEFDPPRNRLLLQPNCSEPMGAEERSQDIVLQNSSRPFIRYNGNTYENVSSSLPNTSENSNKSKRRVKEKATKKSSANKNGCSNHTFKSWTKRVRLSQIQSTLKERPAYVKCEKKPSKRSTGTWNCRLQKDNKNATLPSARRFHSSDRHSRLRPCRDRLTRLKTLLSRLIIVGRSQPKKVAPIKRFTFTTFEQKIHMRYQSSKQLKGTSHRCQCHRERANFVTSYMYFKSPSGVWVRTTRSSCGAHFVSTKNKVRCRILLISEADGHIDIFVRRASGHTNIVCIEEPGHLNIFFQSWPEPISELCLDFVTRVDQNHLEYLQADAID